MDSTNIFADRLTGKKNKTFKLFTESINPGEHASLGLPMPEILGYAPLYMPVKVFHGKNEGPVCLLVASMRGDEYNGMETIKRVMSRSALDHLHGTLIAVPVLNVFGMLNRSRYLPGDQLLEEAFPGEECGTYAARTANLFMSTLFEQCDFCVSFTCGELNHRALPHVYADFSMEENRVMAEAFPVSVLVDAPPPPGSLAACASEAGKPMLTYQSGEAMRVNKAAVHQGSRGVMHLLRQCGMIRANSHEPAAKPELPVICKHNDWIYATKSGIAHPYKQLGAKVSKGEALALINEPLGSFQEVKVTAPHDGIIVGVNELPLVFEGDCLFRLARFEELEAAADAVGSWPTDTGAEDAPASH